MTLKLWRGDAPAIAQRTRITPSGVEIGDIFSLTINGKSISVTATAATAANCCSLLAAAIATAAASIREFGEFTVINAGSSLLLTAATPGVPFTITGSSTNGSTPGVLVSTVTGGAPGNAGTNMTQSFAIPSTATGTGNFTVSIGGQITSGLARDASAATVQSAIEGLSTVGSGNVSVARNSDLNGFVYTLTFQGALAATTVATAIVSLSSNRPIVRTIQQGSSTGTLANEIQTVDVGSRTDATTFDLSIGANSVTGLTGNLTASAFENAIAVIYPTIVTKTGSVFRIEWAGSYSNENLGQFVATEWAGAVTSTHQITVTSTPAVPASTGTNEVQTVTLTGGPTGGTFNLTYDGQTTSAIAYNADAATVDTALEALSNIGSGDVTVTGSAGGQWTVTFGGALAATNLPQMTANGSSLTGGSGQAIAVSEEIASSGPNHWNTALNWLPSGVPANGDDVRFEIGSVNCLYGLNQSSVTLDSLHVSMRYSGQIGLPRLNGDYVEYRPTELAIGATEILIGHGDGSGPSKVALQTGSVQTAIEIRDSGGSSESGVPAITWRGTHVDNAILQFGGELGLAIYSDQSATVDTLIQRGGSLNANRTAFLTSLLFRTGGASFYECTLDGSPVEAY
jgi:trimeric autotransporter adhesin